MSGIIGRPRRRVDGRAKVTGQTRFADDVVLPRMLHCKLLRASVPHGRIRRIGVVPNHYALGWRTNGMTVWDVDDACVDTLGERVGALPCVTHC